MPYFQLFVHVSRIQGPLWRHRASPKSALSDCLATLVSSRKVMTRVVSALHYPRLNMRVFCLVAGRTKAPHGRAAVSRPAEAGEAGGAAARGGIAGLAWLGWHGMAFYPLEVISHQQQQRRQRPRQRETGNRDRQISREQTSREQTSREQGPSAWLLACWCCCIERKKQLLSSSSSVSQSVSRSLLHPVNGRGSQIEKIERRRRRRRRRDDQPRTFRKTPSAHASLFYL